MKKTQDERLQIKNLKHIRTAFAIQTLGIIAILVYDLFTGGFDQLRSNPLWFVFLLTIVVFTYSSMNISVDHEDEGKSPTSGLVLGLTIVTIVAIGLGIFVYLAEGSTAIDGLIVGAVIFVSGLAPILYIYYLRKKQSKE